MCIVVQMVSAAVPHSSCCTEIPPRPVGPDFGDGVSVQPPIAEVGTSRLSFALALPISPLTSHPLLSDSSYGTI